MSDTSGFTPISPALANAMVLVAFKIINTSYLKEIRLLTSTQPQLDAAHKKIIRKNSQEVQKPGKEVGKNRKQMIYLRARDAGGLMPSLWMKRAKIFSPYC